MFEPVNHSSSSKSCRYEDQDDKSRRRDELSPAMEDKLQAQHNKLCDSIPANNPQGFLVEAQDTA